jgi:hypothetical protein
VLNSEEDEGLDNLGWEFYNQFLGFLNEEAFILFFQIRGKEVS